MTAKEILEEHLKTMGATIDDSLKTFVLFAMEEYAQQQVKNLTIQNVSGHVPEDIQTFLHRLRLAQHPEIRKEAIALFQRHCR